MYYNTKIPVEIKKPTSTGCKRLDEAINAVHEKTQAPIEMIILNQISAVAAATQARYKLKMPRGVFIKLCIFAIVVGGTGMRKSSVIDAGIEQITDFEDEQKATNKQRSNHNKSDRKILKSLSAKLTKEISEMIICDEDYSELRNKHIKIEEQLSKKPVDLAFLISQPTPKALALILSKGLKSGYLVNGEGAQLLNSARFANSTPTWNDIWSGSPTSIDTPNDGKIDLSDSNLSTFIAVQDTEFLKFVDKRGSQLEGNGFFQRNLMCWPESNIGYHDKNETDSSLYCMRDFNARLKELLNDNLLNVGINAPDKIIVEFDPEAADYFKEYSKELEYEFRPGHRFAKEAHLITKMPENVARVSANLHIFEYGEGKISLDTLKSAIELCSFYYSELCRILIKPPLHETDANDIDSVFTRRLRKAGIRYAAFRSFRSALPEKAQKNPRFSNAILHLIDTGKISKLEYCGYDYADLYPNQPDDPYLFQIQIGWIKYGNTVHKLVTKFPSLHVFEQAQMLIGAASGQPSMFTNHDSGMPPISPFFSVPKGANNQHGN